MDTEAQNRAGDYPLFHNGNDRSYYRNHAQILGASPILDHLDGGYTFNGSEEIRLTKPHEHQQAGNRSTLVLWFNPDGGIAMGTAERVLWDYGEIYLTVNPGGGLKVYDSGIHTAGGFAAVNAWNHLALVYGQGSVQLYLDGNLILDQSGTKQSYTLADMRMGQRSKESGYEGDMDDIQIFNNALTPAEIDTLYQTTKASKQGGQ